MLTRTFQHLPGVGEVTECRLWKTGILSWKDLERHWGRQLSLFSRIRNGRSALNESWEALYKVDTAFFAELLPTCEWYRIALEFPERTLFLDIETTGLSHVYDRLTMVGWRYDGRYSATIGEELSQQFLDLLHDAAVLVTYNGIRFDVPFLKYKFPEINFPTCHIDLRYLARREGFSGGQKHVEVDLGVARPTELSELRGGDAPLLWYDYLEGDLDALRYLAEYNHADVEGLAAIFDRVVDRIISRIDPPISNVHQFSGTHVPLSFGKEGVHLPVAPPPRDASFTFADLGLNSPRRFVGIDLTGSEERASGWAMLDGVQAKTLRLRTDDELVQATLASPPHVVSIDSPLSLPVGRTRVTDDDPARDVAGITREAERELRRRGVHVYPALLPSMQRLTERGIRLAQRFRDLGFPVIESYPGAAQDIMGIPRKQKGLDVLTQGLVRFGIQGPFADEPVSHDELDAITSAVVAAFFLSGHYEGLGSPEENELIVPHLAPPDTEGSTLVVGISGPSCSGKTTAARMLERNDFCYARFSQIVEEEVKKRGLLPTRENLQAVGAELHKCPGQAWLANRVADRVAAADYAVIDGLRHPRDHSYLVERFDGRFVHIHLKSSREVRRQRWINQGLDPEGFDFAEAHPVEQNVHLLSGLAHVIISNERALPAFLEDVTSSIPAAVDAAVQQCR